MGMSPFLLGVTEEIDTARYVHFSNHRMVILVQNWMSHHGATHHEKSSGTTLPFSNVGRKRKTQATHLPVAT